MRTGFFTTGRIIFYGGLLLFFGFFLLMGVTRMPYQQNRAKISRVNADMKAIEYEFLSRDSLDFDSIPLQQFNDKETQEASGTEYSFLAFDTETVQFPDPFSPRKNTSYAFFYQDSDWLLISAGPDEKFGAHPKDWWTDSEEANRVEIEKKSYDPSNGTISPGDIFRSSLDKGDGDK